MAGAPPSPVTRVTLIDRAPVPADLAADERVTAVRGDLTELDASALEGAAVVFHLAAAVSAECEADFDLGIHANLRGTEALLAACRALGSGPVAVFSSSVAVFGGTAEHPLPAVIEDSTLPVPRTSYGTQKVIGKQLLADYTRKGYLRGRALRLMTVTVRPAARTAPHQAGYPASSGNRWPGSPPPARSRPTRRSPSPPPPRRSPRCSAPPPHRRTYGATPRPSPCPPSR